MFNFVSEIFTQQFNPKNMISKLLKGKNYFYQISLAMLVAMISIVGCKKTEVTPTPVITSFTLETGYVGDVVTITGTDFDATLSDNNTVKFGDKVAAVNTSTITELTVVVPAGATTGKISVTVKGVTGTSVKDFVVKSGAIYIAGYENNATNKTVAKYWKNNTTTNLSDGMTYEESVTSMVVVGNDAYMSGYRASFFGTAQYWKNQTRTLVTSIGLTHLIWHNNTF